MNIISRSNLLGGVNESGANQTPMKPGRLTISWKGGNTDRLTGEPYIHALVLLAALQKHSVDITPTLNYDWTAAALYVLCVPKLHIRAHWQFAYLRHVQPDTKGLDGEQVEREWCRVKVLAKL
ncbi:hypothetical protein PM082_022121 [Marasmius tenuissimus]|nr:hypothetical protein PM082_022121 [Marasmius tenuissimus]